MSEKTAKTDRREVRRAFGASALETLGEFEQALAHHTIVLQVVQKQHAATVDEFREIQTQLLRHTEALTKIADDLSLVNLVLAAILRRERKPFWRRLRRLVLPQAVLDRAAQ